MIDRIPIQRTILILIGALATTPARGVAVEPITTRVSAVDAYESGFAYDVIRTADGQGVKLNDLVLIENDAPGAGDYCLRCHTPKGWLEGRSHPADGSALQAGDIDAGVTCALCHRMVDPKPSQTDEATVIDAAVPVNGFAPADATHAAPIFAIDAAASLPSLPATRFEMLRATALPIVAEGMPVRGGVGEIGVPLTLTRGREIAWGGANAIPAANRLGYSGF